MRRVIVLALSLGLTGVAVLSNGAAAGAKTELSANLTGAAEAPVPGDPEGSGGAVIRIKKDKVCYHVQVSGVEPVTASHIHEAPVGDPGPVVVPLVGKWKSKDGIQVLSGCTRSTEATEIVADPSAYYVNVHTEEFPGGAVRGQLG